MPRGVTLVLFLTGPVMMIGYIGASVVRSWLVSRSRAAQRDSDRVAPAEGGIGAVSIDSATAVEAATVLAAAGGAWLAIRYAAPGRTTFRNASAIGFLAAQVLTAWSSLALWTGLGAVIGHMAPATRRFRDGSRGVAGALALLVTFLPITALAAVGAWISSMRIVRDSHTALVLAYAATVVSEWLFAVLNPPGPWGLVHGPESTLFVAGLAGALTFRWKIDDGTRAPIAGQRDRLPDTDGGDDGPEADGGRWGQ